MAVAVRMLMTIAGIRSFPRELEPPPQQEGVEDINLADREVIGRVPIEGHLVEHFMVKISKPAVRKSRSP